VCTLYALRSLTRSASGVFTTRQEVRSVHIEHVAIWTTNLERLKVFYELYFQARAGKKYHNPKRSSSHTF
jgi:hypothetical protein